MDGFCSWRDSPFRTILPDDTLVKMLYDTRGAMPVDKWAAVPDDTWKISCEQIASFNLFLTTPINNCLSLEIRMAWATKFGLSDPG
jgi:hypothetical protein